VRLQRADYPLVTFDGRLPGLACDSVTTDNFGAAYAATRHLLDLGHRRVALVTRPHTRTSSLRDRRLGYEAALRAAGLVPTPDLLLSCADRGLHTPTGALGAALQVARPTAALALGSWLAAEVVVSMRALGLRAPDDLALVAFDVGTLGAVLEPALTSVEQPAASMGEHAARLLLERLAGWRGPGRQLLLPAQLLIRGSCGGSVGTRLLETVPSGT
jgi:DNA-binding LacI/PurR family transcriptional regulator